jgi:hypothetical protein
LRDPKDVQTWREKAGILKREIVSSKKQMFQELLKHLDYRKDTSEVHKFIASLSNKHSINNSAPINSKNSTKYRDKETVEDFTYFTPVQIIFLNTSRNKENI